MAFKVLQPKNESEALEILQEGEDIVPVAGGTNVMVDIYNERLNPNRLMDLGLIGEFKNIAEKEKEILIGPSVTHSKLVAAELPEQYEVLTAAASEVGGPQIRNRGTVAGNIQNASPAADVALALLALDAGLKLAKDSGERRVALKDFIRGVNDTVLTPGELITEITVPVLDDDYCSLFKKVGKRKAMSISIAGMGLVMKYDEAKVCRDVRIALGAVAPTPVRACKAEKELTGSRLTEENITAAAELAVEEINPISDIRASADYRKRVTKNIVYDGLMKLADRGDENG